jgi:glycosyltransferase involved in cell wall biosynthesis
MRRVLLFVDHAAADFERYRSRLASKARELGFEVVVALPDAPAERAFRTCRFYLTRCSTSPADEARTLVSILRLYRAHRPSLVHLFGVKPALYGGIAARLFPTGPVVSTFTGLGHLFQDQSSGLVRNAAIAGLRYASRKKSSHVVCQIEEDRDVLLRHGIGAAPRMRLIEGLGVDLDLFRATPEPAGPPVVLMAGRLLADKGVHDFVRAAETLRARGVHARFVLLGEPDRGHPSALPPTVLDELKRSQTIEWLGWKTDMPRWFAQSHVICLPTSYGEGIPRVLLEAAASARAIVATDLPGCRKIVNDGVTGLLVHPGDHAKLADALATLIADPARRAQMGIAGRRRVENLFGRDHMAAQYLSLYDECLRAA